MSRHADRSELREHALGAPARDGLAAHLEACDACRLALEVERHLARRIEGELTSALCVEPPPGFDARIRARLREEGAVRRSSIAWRPSGLALRRWLALSVAVAGLAAIAIGTITLRSRRGPGLPAVAGRGEPGQRGAAVGGGALPPVLAGPAAAPSPLGAPPAGGAVTADVGAGPRSRPPRPASGGPPAARHRSGAEPEVLVPPKEARVLARFVAGRERWRLAQTSAGTVAPLGELRPIEIAPLALQALAMDD